MKNKILLLALSLATSLVLSSWAHALVGKHSTVSGYVLSWNKKQVTLFSKGYSLKVPRAVFGKARLKQGQYISNLTYQRTNADNKNFAKFKKNKKARKPASK